MPGLHAYFTDFPVVAELKLKSRIGALRFTSSQAFWLFTFVLKYDRFVQRLSGRMPITKLKTELVHGV